jgi:DNA replication protein DnaC
MDGKIKPKPIGNALGPIMSRFVEAGVKLEKEEAERKAAWDALPEDEKNRIITLREREKQKIEMMLAAKRERMQAERERMLAEMERDRMIREWRNRGITPQFYDASWENWKAETPEQKKVLEKVRQAWKKNLFLIGGNGTGKTHLAMCLAKDGATYCLTPELFRTVRENQNIEQEMIDEYGTCELLVLDEAGRQKGTDFERNLLFEIIDQRWNNRLPTTIIGNIDKKEFADLYGLAVLDRLRPETVEFTWGSMRAFSWEEKVDR